MKMRYIIMVPAFIALCGSAGVAGTGPAAFLNIGVGARALAMGGAFTSVSDDATAMYWNPAGLGMMNRRSLTAMGQSAGASEWDTLASVTPRYQFIGFTFPVNTFSIPFIDNPSNTFGVGMISSGLNDIPYTTVDGAGVVDRSTFDDSENAYFLSYALPLSSADGLYAGATLKYIRQEFTKISDATATGFDMDFGLLYHREKLSLGLLLERGAQLKWANGHTDSAPLTTRFGVSNNFMLSEAFSILGSLDIVQRQSQPLTMNVGAELGYVKEIAVGGVGLKGTFLRMGIDSFAVEDRYGYRDFINNNTNFTAGAGLNINLWGYLVQFDYSLGSYRLGSRNRISMNLYF